MQDYLIKQYELNNYNKYGQYFILSFYFTSQFYGPSDLVNLASNKLSY